MVEKTDLKTTKQICMVESCGAIAYRWYSDAQMWLCKKHLNEYQEADYKYD